MNVSQLVLLESSLDLLLIFEAALPGGEVINGIVWEKLDMKRIGQYECTYE